jgi:hypothetical protein
VLVAYVFLYIRIMSTQSSQQPYRPPSSLSSSSSSSDASGRATPSFSMNGVDDVEWDPESYFQANMNLVVKSVKQRPSYCLPALDRIAFAEPKTSNKDSLRVTDGKSKVLPMWSPVMTVEYQPKLWTLGNYDPEAKDNDVAYTNKHGLAKYQLNLRLDDSPEHLAFGISLVNMLRRVTAVLLHEDASAYTSLKKLFSTKNKTASDEINKEKDRDARNRKWHDVLLESYAKYPIEDLSWFKWGRTDLPASVNGWVVKFESSVFTDYNRDPEQKSKEKPSYKAHAGFPELKGLYDVGCVLNEFTLFSANNEEIEMARRRLEIGHKVSACFVVKVYSNADESSGKIPMMRVRMEGLAAQVAEQGTPSVLSRIAPPGKIEGGAPYMFIENQSPSDKNLKYLWQRLSTGAKMLPHANRKLFYGTSQLPPPPSPSPSPSSSSQSPVPPSHLALPAPASLPPLVPFDVHANGGHETKRSSFQKPLPIHPPVTHTEKNDTKNMNQNGEEKKTGNESKINNNIIDVEEDAKHNSKKGSAPAVITPVNTAPPPPPPTATTTPPPPTTPQNNKKRQREKDVPKPVKKGGRKRINKLELTRATTTTAAAAENDEGSTNTRGNDDNEGDIPTSP